MTKWTEEQLQATVARISKAGRVGKFVNLKDAKPQPKEVNVVSGKPKRTTKPPIPTEHQEQVKAIERVAPAEVDAFSRMTRKEYENKILAETYGALITGTIDCGVASLSQNSGAIVLPYPPTVNNYFTVARGRKILSKRGREYRKSVLATIGPRMPFLKRLSVTVELFAPDKRRRDLDNITKAVFDALQHAGVYQDDSQIDYFSVQRCAIVKGGVCSVTVKEI